MCKLRERSGREGVFDRRAEDCEKGAEGESGEEALRGWCSIMCKGYTVVNMMATIA